MDDAIDDGNAKQAEKHSTATGAGNDASDDGDAKQAAQYSTAGQHSTATGGGKQQAATGVGNYRTAQTPNDDDDFDGKQVWCYTTRMLACKKIRERNPWTHSERMQAWST